MKGVTIFATTFVTVCLWVGSSNAAMLAMYGAKSANADCNASSHQPANCYAKRVGIFPTPPCSQQYESASYESVEEPRERGVDHYSPPPPAPMAAGGKHCSEKMLPVSICVQLPPDAPVKLSKNLLQQIVYSLVQDPVVKRPYDTHRKPCEYPKKPCACANKPYVPPKEPCDVPKPCAKPTPAPYVPTKKPCDYPTTPKPCTTMKPTAKPCAKESYKPRYGMSAEGSYESYFPVKALPFMPPKDSYMQRQYGAPKESCAPSTTEPPCYKPPTTTPAPCTTPAPPTPCPHKPSPRPYNYAAPTQSTPYAPYTVAPRYPSVPCNSSSYPKPTYGSVPSYEPKVSSCACKEPANYPSVYPKKPCSACSRGNQYSAA
ncbi:uncharacterized protein LOC128724618 [Anopheles nili]|uniref:uncharacterized protein LOC128724618 n=1 Tax=Anopheles nili TaxID=185578 RepID=UPI00237A6B54|nr:uncharacterized protein LOC128724618 [Anopheles nili]